MADTKTKELEEKAVVMMCPQCEAEIEDSAESCPQCLAPLKVARRQGKPTYLLDEDRVNAFGFTLISDVNNAKTYKRITDTEYGRRDYPLVDYVVMFDTGGYYMTVGGMKCFCPACQSYLTEVNGSRTTVTPLPCKNTLRKEKHGRDGTCKTRTMFAIGYRGMENV